MRYAPNWRMTVFIAIFVHFFLWLGAGFLLPLLEFQKAPAPLEEMAVVDIEEPVAMAESPPAPLVSPIQPPEPAVEESLPTDLTPIEEAELVEETVAELEQKIDAANLQGQDSAKPERQNMMFGAVVKEGYTPDTRGLDFRGRVVLFVFVDATGTVKDVRISRGSGRTVIDTICKNAAWKFKFEPAIDAHNQPMKIAQRVISFPFDGTGPHLYEDDENKRIRTNRELWLRERREEERQDDLQRE